MPPEVEEDAKEEEEEEVHEEERGSSVEALVAYGASKFRGSCAEAKQGSAEAKPILEAQLLQSFPRPLQHRPRPSVEMCFDNGLCRDRRGLGYCRLSLPRVKRIKVEISRSLAQGPDLGNP